MSAQNLPTKPWEINRTPASTSTSNFGNLRSSAESGLPLPATPPVPPRPSSQQVFLSITIVVGENKFYGGQLIMALLWLIKHLQNFQKV